VKPKDVLYISLFDYSDSVNILHLVREWILARPTMRSVGLPEFFRKHLDTKDWPLTKTAAFVSGASKNVLQELSDLGQSISRRMG